MENENPGENDMYKILNHLFEAMSSYCFSELFISR